MDFEVTRLRITPDDDRARSVDVSFAGVGTSNIGAFTVVGSNYAQIIGPPNARVVGLSVGGGNLQITLNGQRGGQATFQGGYFGTGQFDRQTRTILSMDAHGKTLGVGPGPYRNARGSLQFGWVGQPGTGVNTGTINLHLDGVQQGPRAFRSPS